MNGRIRIALALLSATLLAAPGAEAARKKSGGPPATAPDRHTVTRGRLLMGTLCTAIAEGVDSAHVSRTLERAFGEIERLDQALSSWRDSSELAVVNRARAQTRQPLSPDLCRVLSAALAIAAETEGAFDPTVEPLNRAWDLRGEGRAPDREELNDARSRVGWRRVLLDTARCEAWFQRDRMALDLGGIGKGYALDRVEAVLRAAGIERALINFGGEVLALSDGAGWTVRVAHPGERGRPAVELAVRTAAVSTSGQSERGVAVGNVWRGHVLDPAAGTPVATPASVTVVTRSATRADALATALLVMGREKALAFAAERADIGVLWLEPYESGVRAWRWNLPAAAASPGMKVDWRD